MATHLIGTYLPDYDVFSKVPAKILGIKTNLLFLSGLLFYVSQIIRSFAGDGIWRHVESYFVSIITLDEYDDLYKIVLDWLINQPRTQASSYLIGITPSAFSRDYSSVQSSTDSISVLKYQPDYHHIFLCCYKGMPLWFQRVRLRLGKLPEEQIKLYILGSNKTVKDFLHDRLVEKNERRKDSIFICFPLSKEFRGSQPWAQKLERPSRNMDTVILRPDVKEGILSDVDRFYSQRSWYKRRSISYRRGHCYVGAPGTGKTSAAQAVAAEFGLDIYVIPLSDPDLTDDDLRLLVSRLPVRSLVQLDDIDATNIWRQRSKARIGSGHGELGGVTLSGLLNAMDGMGSLEGVLFVLTTNHPEKLDKALMRPGRIDLMLEFPLPETQELVNIFRWMYSDIEEGVDAMAEDFASRLPEKIFSHAEIQGFLISHKDAPRAALRAVKQWTVDQRAMRN